MTTSDNDKENDSTEEKKDTAEDRLDKIKKEEQEDASSYYSQGKEETPDVREEFEKPVPEIDKAKEDMNLLRAVAFLGFGLAALAIIFILFFIRDLDERVGGVDSAVNKLEGTIGPLKTEIEGSIKAVEENLNAVTQTVAGLQGKLGDYEKSMAIMELKRALVMVQGISMGSETGVKSKSSEVAASIQSLLNELGGAAPSEEPAGEIQVQEAIEEPMTPAEKEPEAVKPEEAPAEEPVAEEPAAEDVAEESEEAEAEKPAEESEQVIEETSGERAGEEAVEESEEAETEETSEEAETEETGGEAGAEESAGDDHASDEPEGADKTAGVEELPTVEELLQESE